MLFLVLCVKRRYVHVCLCPCVLSVSLLLLFYSVKHVVCLYSYTCFYSDLSALPRILLTHCSFTLPPPYICAGYVLYEYSSYSQFQIGCTNGE